MWPLCDITYLPLPTLKGKRIGKVRRVFQKQTTLALEIRDLLYRPLAIPLIPGHHSRDRLGATERRLYNTGHSSLAFADK